MSNLVHKTFDTLDVEQKAGAGSRVRRFVFSTDSMDRDHEVVIPSGLRFDEYLKNPQFLWAHKYDIPPIGKCVGIELVNNGRALVGDVEFAKHKFADEIFALYREGFMRAVSVGFRALVAQAPSQEMLALRPELAKCYRVITAGNLFEVSAVPIPSNPDSLMEKQATATLSSEAPMRLRIKTGDEAAREIVLAEAEALIDIAMPLMVAAAFEGALRETLP